MPAANVILSHEW